MSRIGLALGLMFFCGLSKMANASQCPTIFDGLDGTSFSKIIDYFPETLEDRVVLYGNLSMTCKGLKALVAFLPPLETYFPDYYARLVPGILNPSQTPKCMIPAGYTFDPLIEKLLGKAVYESMQHMPLSISDIYTSWKPFGLPYLVGIKDRIEPHPQNKIAIAKEAYLKADPWILEQNPRGPYEEAMKSTHPIVLSRTYVSLNDNWDGKPRNEKARDIYKRGEFLNHSWYYDQRFDEIDGYGAKNEHKKSISPEAITFIHENLPRHCGWSMEYLIKKFTSPNESLQSANANFFIIDGLDEKHQIRSRAKAIAFIYAYMLRDDKDVQPFHQAAIKLIREKKLSPFVKKSDLEALDQERQKKYQKYLTSRSKRS